MPTFLLSINIDAQKIHLYTMYVHTYLLRNCLILFIIEQIFFEFHEPTYIYTYLHTHTHTIAQACSIRMCTRISVSPFVSDIWTAATELVTRTAIKVLTICAARYLFVYVQTHTLLHCIHSCNVNHTHRPN